MSDSVYIFDDPMDSAWDRDKLEPDRLDIPPELEVSQDFADEEALREETKANKQHRSSRDMWNDLALDEFIVEAQRERMQATPASETQEGQEPPQN